jgi:Ca2+-binding EF-hand superfamily protein
VRPKVVVVLTTPNYKFFHYNFFLFSFKLKKKKKQKKTKKKQMADNKEILEEMADIKTILCNNEYFESFAKMEFEIADTDNSGYIQFSEYKKVMAKVLAATDLDMDESESGSGEETLKSAEETLKNSYMVMDTDQSGILSYEEFKEVLRTNLESILCAYSLRSSFSNYSSVSD